MTKRSVTGDKWTKATVTLLSWDDDKTVWVTVGFVIGGSENVLAASLLFFTLVFLGKKLSQLSPGYVLPARWGDSWGDSWGSGDKTKCHPSDLRFCIVVRFVDRKLGRCLTVRARMVDWGDERD